ncbi:anaphase-promoting complex subunit 4 [Elysia marginata]|uniref:Anaphase-promoting complex subunit 4 n=1 Tax=Elysia marginata TaxID=1093978 RepID=A0AAV4G1D1_9GAST|nr:anaphase-promoting complex subunit 4 [Elysia marginata]
MSEETKRFKLRDEKQVASEIILMEWSPTMDLIALANANGEVLVNRLSWQRVWLLPAYDERQKQIQVSALSWRPDGKILSIGYTNGVFRLCEVEKGEIIREEIQVNDEITSLTWLEQSKSMVEGRQTYPEDSSSTYLPQAYQQTSLYHDLAAPKNQPPGHEIQEIFRNLASKKELGLLLVGTNTNKVHLYGYGVFHLCILELSIDSASESLVVDSAIISPDLSRLAVVVKSLDPGETNSIHIQVYDTALLVTRHEEIRLLCSKYIMIISSDLEIDLILNQMCEAWEEILREMDSKLLHFAKSKQSASRIGQWVAHVFFIFPSHPQVSCPCLHHGRCRAIIHSLCAPGIFPSDRSRKPESPSLGTLQVTWTHYTRM